MTISQRASLTFVIVLTLLAAAIGVHADPLCRRLVREYREKRVRNTVSKQTAARWAEWNKTHPNYQPHPRPKYKLVPEEVVKQVQFACQVPTKPVDTSELLPPIVPDFNLGPAQPNVVLTPPVLPGVVEVSTASTPPPPFLPPYSPGVPPGIAPVPEPSSLVFSLTGTLFVGITAFCARRRSLSVARTS
jgi:hypothetical protein